MSRITIIGLLLLDGCLASDAPAGDVGEVTSDVSSVYTPFSGSSSSGSVATYPWHGYKTTYPAGDENLRTYHLPSSVECSSTKATVSHLDVTAGCLTAVDVGGYSRGKITTTSDGAFRMVALPFTGSETSPLKWTDQSNSYRFYYTGASSTGTDPGFKAFVRYRTEDDLYVASWRLDGVVQIKRKRGGAYTLLAQANHGTPTTRSWHTLRFQAVGSRLYLDLDGTRILSATDGTFSWGTAGIRTDATSGALIDEWTIAAP